MAGEKQAPPPVGVFVYGETFSGEVVSVDPKKRTAQVMSQSGVVRTVDFDSWAVVGETASVEANDGTH